MDEKKEFFDDRAEIWDEINHYDLQKIDHIISLLGLNGNEKIMDVGTGTGVLFPFYKDVLSNGSVLALDMSEKMIFQARKNAERINFKNIDFEVNNVLDITHDSGFDAVMCYSCYPHFSERDKVIENLCRALRPGGKLMIAHSASKEYINGVHTRNHGAVSKDILPEMKDLEILLISKGFSIETKRDDEEYYLIMGKRIG